MGIKAIKRINLNADILLDMLNVLEVRPELSDGAVYSAVAAKRIAAATVSETGKVTDKWGVCDLGRPGRKAALSELAELAAMIKKRADGVRSHHGLESSKSALEIMCKYLPLAEAIKAAIATDSAEPDNSLETSYL